MAAFGWSVGDIVASIRIAADIAKAFKEIGGASSRFKQSQDFLTGFRITLEHLKKYAEDNPDDKYVSDLNDQLARIESPWKDFKVFVDKYERSLDETSERPRLLKAPRIVKWTIKDLTGEVEKLEQAIAKPVQVINSLLSLQSLENIAGLPDKLLSSAQFTKLLDDTNLTQLSSAIDSSIARLEQVVSQRRDTERDETQARELNALQHVSQCMENFRAEVLEDAAQGREVHRTCAEESTRSVTKRIERLYERLSQPGTEKMIEAQQAMMVTMQAALEAKITALQDDLRPAQVLGNLSAESQDPSIPAGVFSAIQWAGIVFTSLASGIVTSVGILGGSRLLNPVSHASVLPRNQSETPYPRPILHNGGSSHLSRGRLTQSLRSTNVLWADEFSQTQRDRQTILQARSFTRSSAMPFARRYQTLSSVPSLHYASEIPSAKGSEISVVTNLASEIPELPLPQEVNRILHIPCSEYRRTPSFSCTFWYLPCGYISNDIEEWKTHCLAHFRGRSPPRKMECPCCVVFTSMEDNGHDTFSLYLEHMANHLRKGENPESFSVRKERYLYLYLWNERIISDITYEHIKSRTIDPVITFEGLLTARNTGSDRRMPTSRAGPSARGYIQNKGYSDADTIVSPSNQDSDCGDTDKNGKNVDEKKDTAESKTQKKPRYFLSSKLVFC